MPFLKRKSVEDLVVGKDMLYSKAGNIAAAGSVVTDSLIQRLIRNKVPVVTVIYLAKEDEAKGLSRGDVERLVKDKEDTDFSLLRMLLFESVKKLYKPYSELTNKAFWGKLGEKLIKEDFLLERRPDLLYKAGIHQGSFTLYNTNDSSALGNDQKAISDILDKICELLEQMEYRSADVKPGAKTMPRLFLDSIRLGTIFDAEAKSAVRILDPGNALAWHAVDTAILTLYALTNMSMKRRALGFPESIDEYSRSKQAITSHHTIKAKADRFCYPRETIIQAAIGCVLHSLGYAHTTISRVVSKRPMLSGSEAHKEAVKTVRKGQFVVRNLFAERDDVSAIAKKVIWRMKQYPDGSGYPLIEAPESAVIPEYARMANIADDYDELTNPILNPNPLSRMEALACIRKGCGEYRPGVFSSKYDAVLFDEFTQVLKPYETNERVDLFLEGKRSRKYYCGFVRSYSLTRAFLPQVSVLKNADADEAYGYGRVLFDLEEPKVLVLDEEGRLVGSYRKSESAEGGGSPKPMNPKIGEMLRHMGSLVILDEMKGSCSLADYVDPVYGVSKA
jgi:hypothetical protein